MRPHTQIPYSLDGTLHWFVGFVEARNDPLQMGRVQVRIIGFHDNEEKIPTEHLPWATPLNPINSASMSGVGTSPVGMMEGTMVAGFWGDYPDCQVPIIMGTFNLQEGFGATFGGDVGQGGLFNPYSNTVGDNSPVGPGVIMPVGDGPPWLQIARGEADKGIKEWKGARHNPEVVKYARTTGYSEDDTPWCASFVKWCLLQAGVNAQAMTASSQSPLSMPDVFERLDQPLYGAIWVHKWSGTGGHTGFFVQRQKSDVVLGGNQSDSVSIKGMGVIANRGYWWPRGFPKEYSNNTANDLNGQIIETIRPIDTR